MRISDWSSDVCSSDLSGGNQDGKPVRLAHQLEFVGADHSGTARDVDDMDAGRLGHAGTVLPLREASAGVVAAARRIRHDEFHNLARIVGFLRLHYGAHTGKIPDAGRAGKRRARTYKKR